MMRLTSQRGVSLMVLIIMIAVFAGIAVSIVTLLRARHESYPYQVQSYQAYALAHAGVEFAIRYAKENADAGGNYQTFLTANIPATGPGRQFNFSNGSFWLRYDPGTGGCNDTLYSRGKYGTATREVKISNFGALASAQVSGEGDFFVPANPADWSGGRPVPLYISGPITKGCYGDSLNPSCIQPTSPYKGDQISFTTCDPSSYTRGPLDSVGPFYPNWFEASGSIPGNPPPITIAATNPVVVMRVGYASKWVWDGTCQGSCPGWTYTGIQSPTVWDGTTNPPPGNQSVQLDFNTQGKDIDYSPKADQYCRPQRACDANPATCCDPNPGCAWPDPGPCCSTHPTLGQCCGSYAACTDLQRYQWLSPTDVCTGGAYLGPTRTDWTCGAPGNPPYVIGGGAAPFVIQTLGPIPSNTKFYVSFWTRPHYLANTTGSSSNNYLQVQTKLIFTVN